MNDEHTREQFEAVKRDFEAFWKREVLPNGWHHGGDRHFRMVAFLSYVAGAVHTRKVMKAEPPDFSEGS